MQRDPLASSKARKAERKADEKSGLITIKPIPVKSDSLGTGTSSSLGTTGSGFKKGGFRNAFGEGEKEKVIVGVIKKEDGKVGEGEKAEMGEVESESDDGDYERYDPLRPTDCWEGCGGRV